MKSRGVNVSPVLTSVSSVCGRAAGAIFVALGALPRCTLVVIGSRAAASGQMIPMRFTIRLDALASVIISSLRFRGCVHLRLRTRILPSRHPPLSSCPTLTYSPTRRHSTSESLPPSASRRWLPVSAMSRRIAPP